MLLWLIFRDVLTIGELIAMQFILVVILAPPQVLATSILVWREGSSLPVNFEELTVTPVDMRKAPAGCALLTEQHVTEETVLESGAEIEKGSPKVLQRLLDERDALSLPWQAACPRRWLRCGTALIFIASCAHAPGAGRLFGLCFCWPISVWALG